MKFSQDFFFDQLKHHHLRITSCRKAMIEALVHVDHPFTAEELLQRIQDERSIHRATIYRDIAWFVKADILRELSFLGIPSTIYEVNDATHHHHFVCELCHTIVDVNTDAAELGLEEIEKHLTLQGLHVRSHSLKFYGTCQACKQKEAYA